MATGLEALTLDGHITRLLGRPGAFAGHVSSWRDWKFVFMAYIEALSPELGAEMALCEAVQGEMLMSGLWDET